MRSSALFLAAVALGCGATARELKLRPAELPPALRAEATEIATAFAAEPNDASVLYQVAAILARAGRSADALEALRRMAALGSGVDPRPSEFAALANEPEYQRIVAAIRAANPPVLHAKPAFSLGEADLVPEGIAWSATTQRLYLGSMKRKIVAVDRAGQVTELVAPGSGGLGVVLGIRVDDARGELWAASDQLGGAAADAVTGLFRFRLADGALLARYPIAAGPGGFVNDVAIAPDGSAYATLTQLGSVVRVERATGRVETFLPPGSVPDVNGIAVSRQGDALFVAGWHAIYRVELASRRVRALDKPSQVAAGCFDGLYVDRDDLVGVQNCVHSSGRVVRLHLDAAGRRIERATVLESYNPLFDDITTAAIAGDTLYFVANVQLRKSGPAARFDPPRVLALPLTHK